MKNLRITVNGTAYDVQVEELGEIRSSRRRCSGSCRGACSR